MLLLGLLAFGAVARAEDAASAPLELTPEEKAWIAAHPVVRVGHFDGASPYCVRDAAGRIGGLNVDYLNLIARRTGLRFEHVTFRVWVDAFRAAEQGEIDLAAGLGRTPDRLQWFTFGRPFAFSPDVIVTRTDSPIFFDKRELNGLRVGLARSSPSLRTVSPGVIEVGYDNMRDAIRAVAHGEVQAAVTDALVTAHVVKTESLTNLRIGVIYDDEAKVYFGVRKDLPVLSSIVDKALVAVTPAEQLEIRGRWLAVDYVESRWWLTAFKIVSVAAVAALLVALVSLFHQRRLARELELRRAIQDELERTRDHLTQANTEKSELMHMLAHDLRNPVTSVVMGSDLLRMSELTREQAEMVTRLRAHAQKMGRLIDDLMDANAIEAGQRKFHFDPIDVRRTVRAAVEAFAESAAQKQLRLEFALPDDPVVAHTDEGAFRQVIDNFLSNAVKYSPPHRRIEIALVAAGEEMRLSVTDEGPGVSTEDITRLFRKFGTGSARPTGGEKSSGLGLWIVQRVADALGGRVWCESAPGKGASFVFTLPLGARRTEAD